MFLCPCGSGRLYEQCCGIYISGAAKAPTPEALMRSRYVAYTQANIDYICATMCGKAAKGFDTLSAEQWAKSVIWQGLKVIEAKPVGMKSTTGFVEFIAKFLLKSHPHQIHEVSEFHCIDGVWFYVDGNMK